MVHATAVKDPADITDEAERLDALFRAKALAEIAVAEALAGDEGAVRGQGDELADVLLAKGEPGPDDLDAGRALAGADGEAAGKALDALGIAPARFAFCTRSTDLPESARLERTRLMVEAVDPRIIIALDPLAAGDVLNAYGCKPVPAGTLTRVQGRAFVALEGLEASLSDEALKRRVWRQLKALGPLGQAGE